MLNRLAATSFAVLIGLAAAAAQGPTPPAPSTPAQTQPASPPDGSTGTATGCLRAGTEPGTYVLSNVRWMSTGSSSKDPSAHHDSTPKRDRPTTPATAVTGDRETPAAGETLRLAGAATLKMKDHIGHTVTITGMLANADPVVRPGILLPDPAQRGDTTSRTPPAEPPAPAGPKVLNVRSITHVAETCK